MIADDYVLLRDGDTFGAEVRAVDAETTPTGFGIVDFVARHCFRHVHAFADLSDVSDERALLVTVAARAARREVDHALGRAGASRRAASCSTTTR